MEVRRFQDDNERRHAVVERAASSPNRGCCTRVHARTPSTTHGNWPHWDLLPSVPRRSSAAERTRVHRAFQSGGADVIVATSAFGMGIDKEDVRYVLHAALPGSLDAYYQQIGRCGGDDRPADAVLYYRREDTGMRDVLRPRTPAEA
ncbi:hypothetical protein LV779_36385 [Streptomyces thinghirensis]|nr:hypothetical protein [Streptomyces thinghirensis]